MRQDACVRINCLWPAAPSPGSTLVVARHEPGAKKQPLPAAPATASIPAAVLPSVHLTWHERTLVPVLSIDEFLAQQFRERMDKQAYQTTDDRSVDSDKLQVLAYLQLQFAA